MSQKAKYFKLLGIAPTTDKNKIKKAYRTKALSYHPDKNPSEDAQKKFIEINEAYEALTGIHYKKESAKVRPKTAEEIKAEKIERAKKQRRKMEEREQERDRRYFQKITSGWRWKFFRIGAIYCFLFTLLLSADYFLTSHHKAVPRATQFSFLPETIEVEGELFQLPNALYWISDSQPVQLNYSFFFKDLKSVNVIDQLLSLQDSKWPSGRMMSYRLFDTFRSNEYYSYGSVYYVFPFLHICLLIPLLVLFFKRPHFYFALGRLITIWAIFPLVLYLSFSNGRIFHLFGLL